MWRFYSDSLYSFVDTGFVSKFRSKPSCLGLKFEEIFPDLIFSIVLCNICAFTTVFWLPFGVRHAFILSVFFFFFECCDYYFFVCIRHFREKKKLTFFCCILTNGAEKFNFFFAEFDESPLIGGKLQCFLNHISFSNNVTFF